jgi:hypothetical protein
MLTARRLASSALAALVLALACAVYVATATTAGAMPTPPPLEDTPNPGLTAPPVTTVVNRTGSAVWTYLVVALAAVVVTLAGAWMVTRLRHAHAHGGSAHAQTA